MDLSKPSIGVCGDFLEYRRMIYRRLFVSEDFNKEEALYIEQQLERVTEFNCLRKIKIQQHEFYVHIGSFGGVRLPIGKGAERIRSRSLDYIADIPDKTNF